MMRTLAFWSFLTASIFAQTPESVFEQANQKYTASSYAEARALYQTLIDEGHTAKELYFNMGNACYKMKSYGYAMYYYEKARLLDPEDEDVAGNIELTQLRLKDKIVVPPDFVLFELGKQFLGWFSITQLVLITTGLLYALVAWHLIRRWKGWPLTTWTRILSGTGLVFLALSVVTTTFKLTNEIRQKEAIILAPSVEVKSEPIPGSVTAFILHEGTKVRVRAMRDDRTEIRLPDGKTGWVPNDEIGVL